MSSNRIPILTYHSLDDSRSAISTSPSIFKEQMESLWESGYKTLSLCEVVSLIQRRMPLPRDTFVITFDDGYKNIYTHAFPLLQRLGYTCTIFLISDYCGKLNDWPGHSPLIERRALLSWSEIKSMHKRGVEFGAHTSTHPDLTQISIRQAEREIIRSKAEIEDRLGINIGLFAYPYGKYNSKVKDIVRANFLGASSTNLGRVGCECDPYALSRVDMYYFSNYALFSAMSAGIIDWYLGIRQIFRGLRERVKQPGAAPTVLSGGRLM